MSDNEIERLSAQVAALQAERDRAVEQSLESAATVLRMQAERDALRADAERYRWLRLPDSNVPISHESAKNPEAYDAAIDAARRPA